MPQGVNHSQEWVLYFHNTHRRTLGLDFISCIDWFYNAAGDSAGFSQKSEQQARAFQKLIFLSFYFLIGWSELVAHHWISIISDSVRSNMRCMSRGFVYSRNMKEFLAKQVSVNFWVKSSERKWSLVYLCPEPGSCWSPEDWCTRTWRQPWRWPVAAWRTSSPTRTHWRALGNTQKNHKAIYHQTLFHIFFILLILQSTSVSTSQKYLNVISILHFFEYPYNYYKKNNTILNYLK